MTDIEFAGLDARAQDIHPGLWVFRSSGQLLVPSELTLAVLELLEAFAELSPERFDALAHS